MNWWFVGLLVTLVPPLALLVAMLIDAICEGSLRPKRPLTADYCRTCDAQLARGRVYEVRSGHEADPETGGGTFLAITYCRRHAPRGAVRA